MSSIPILFIDLIRVEKHFYNQKKKIQELIKKLYSNDRDIKTLHFNQKMLQSSIKELRRDLKIYGEIKRSKDKCISSEKTDEDDWPEDTGTF